MFIYPSPSHYVHAVCGISILVRTSKSSDFIYLGCFVCLFAEICVELMYILGFYSSLENSLNRFGLYPVSNMDPGFFPLSNVPYGFQREFTNSAGTARCQSSKSELI